MKESGIPLVGNIPIHWNKKPIKYCTLINERVLSETTSNDYLFRYIDIGSVDFYKGIMYYEELSFNTAPSRARRIVKKGDVIVSTVRTYLKAVAEITDDIDVIVSTGFAVLTPKPEIEPRYLAYFCKSNAFCDEIERNSYGISYPAINSSALGCLEITLPPLDEQIIISNLLDKKCEKIDKLISLEETAITELKDYKKSIIQKAVTKGIKKSRKLKNSGIEWIGDIPEEWDIVPIGGIYQTRNTKVSDKDYMPLSVGYMGVVPQLENAAKTDDGDNRKLVLKNDFVINSRADRRGACGISELYGSVSLINIVLKPLKNAFNNYYRYLFKSTNFSDEFYKWGNGIVDDLWSTKWSDMKRIFIPIPPYNEQKEIADYLDKKQNCIDNLILLKQQKIAELKEYKKSLIYEYVTGKKQTPKKDTK